MTPRTPTPRIDPKTQRRNLITAILLVLFFLSLIAIALVASIPKP